MSLPEVLKKFNESKIYCLKQQGVNNAKPLGFRIKLYNQATDSYAYYDFELDTFKGTDCQAYINSNYKNFPDLMLKPTTHNGNSLLASDDEISTGKYVDCFSDQAQAVEAIETFKKIQVMVTDPEIIDIMKQG